MSVLIEGLTLVVKKLELEIRYPGGPQAFGEALLELSPSPRFVCIADADLVNVGFYDPEHLRPAAELLVAQGFTAVEDGTFVDFAYVDQHHGPALPCAWLQWRRHADGFTAAWLSGADPSEMAVYEGWTLDNSRAMRRSDIRDDPGRTLPLGSDESLEYALDLKTGEVLAALPHREFDPADGPPPSAAAQADPMEIDLDAILAELDPDLKEPGEEEPDPVDDDADDDEFPEGPILSVITSVLRQDGVKYDRAWPSELEVEFSRPSGPRFAWMTVDEDAGNVDFRMTAETRVPDAARRAVAEAVVRINFDLVHGGFELNMNTGEVRFREAHVVGNQALSPETARALLHGGIERFERYLPALMKVAFAGAEPHTAVGAVRSDADEAPPPTGSMRIHWEAQKPPMKNAYQVPDVTLHAGEYPFSADPATGPARLRALLDAGVTTFIDLTTPHDNLSPYIDALRELAAERKQGELRYFPLGFTDNSIPESPDRMRRILDTVDEALGEGRRVYLHCMGGVGRTGVAVGCWLVRHGMPGEDALKMVNGLFGTMSPEKVARHRSWGSPQTEAQRTYVREWKELTVHEDDHALLLLPAGWKPPTGFTIGISRTNPRLVLDLRDRVRGALIGLAAGDALGATNEFKRPGTFTPITDMVGGGPHMLQPGQWTDDTSLALCLAESLVECREMDAGDQLQRYVRWWRKGHLSSTGRCFDIGTTTSEALRRFEKTGSTTDASDRSRAPNGSLMRLAPVPMLYWTDAQAAVDHAAASSRTTHGSALPVDTCRYLAALVVGAIRGVPKDELLAPFYSPVPGLWESSPLEPEVAAVAAGSFRSKAPPAIRGTGYCVDALEAALWAFNASHDFRTGALLAVNLGDDADTTGAIYGQVAGAFYGERSIPEEWRSRLALREVLDRSAETLFQLSLRLLPRLNDDRRENAQTLVQNALAQWNTPADSLAAIYRMRGAESSELSVVEYYMSGSMGAAAAEEEALMQLRVLLGLEWTR
jgi:ADP-ribosyl-[dinitrogen reductase] hydrolase